MVDWGPLLGALSSANIVLLTWLHLRTTKIESKLDRKVDKEDCALSSARCQTDLKGKVEAIWQEHKGHAHTPDGRVIVKQG